MYDICSGGRILGQHPGTYDLNDQQITGRGAWIPTTANEGMWVSFYLLLWIYDYEPTHSSFGKLSFLAFTVWNCAMVWDKFTISIELCSTQPP